MFEAKAEENRITSDNPRLEPRHREISLKINECINDINSELEHIDYQCQGYQMNRNEIRNKTIFSAFIIFKKLELGIGLQELEESLPNI
jgi:hypothetical protein